jgi:hypothetical protein
MSTDEKIIKNKLGLLKLAEMLGNVSEARKVRHTINQAARVFLYAARSTQGGLTRMLPVPSAPLQLCRLFLHGRDRCLQPWNPERMIHWRWLRTFGRLHHGGGIVLDGQEALMGFSKGRDFGPRATGDVKLKVVALHLVHQVIA